MWCVEIKPKWGSLPTSPYLRPQDSVKRVVPRFTMMQQYKLQRAHKRHVSAVLRTVTRASSKVKNATVAKPLSVKVQSVPNGLNQVHDLHVVRYNNTLH